MNKMESLKNLTEGTFVKITGMEVKNDNDIFVVDSDYRIEGKYAICRDERCLHKVKLNGEQKTSGYNIVFVDERMFQKNPNAKVEIVTDLKKAKKEVNNWLKGVNDEEIVVTYEKAADQTIKKGDLVRFTKGLTFGTFGDKYIGTKSLWIVEDTNNRLALREVGTKAQDISTGKNYGMNKGLFDHIVNGEYLEVLNKIETKKGELNNNIVVAEVEENIEIAEQESQKEIKETLTTTTEGITVEFNEEKNGIEITFDSKELATEEIRSALKSVGFRWFGKFGKWIARQTEESIAMVNSLFAKVEEQTQEVAADSTIIDEVVVLEDKEPVNAQDFNNIETLRDKYITNWSSIPKEIQQFILSCNSYWIDVQEVILYQDKKAVASMGITLSGINVTVNSIGALFNLFQWNINEGFTINNLVKNDEIEIIQDIEPLQTEIIDNSKLIIFIEGEGCISELTTNDIVKATENLNTRIMKEYESEYGGYSKTWITLTLNGESHRFRYDIDNKIRLTTNIIKLMIEQEQAEYDYTMKNINKFTYMNAEEYEKEKLECIEFLNNLLTDNSTEIIIKDDPFQRALNTIEDNNLYEINADSKTVIADNRYIKNVYCNGLTVVTGRTIKELIEEGQGVDILNLKPLKMDINIFMEGIKKHDLKQIMTLFPTETDKQLEKIVFMDRLQFELNRANTRELMTV